MANEQGGAFTVVDIETLFKRDVSADSLWHGGSDEEHIKGRACKIYALINEE
jgi:hypothetical protein